jgi:hypothetical protein
MFRYWVDEILWSQGRVATITIEEVLEQLGGQRTGGPHKPTLQKVSSDVCTQQLLQHMKLTDPQLQLQQQQQQQQQQQLLLLRKQASVLSSGQTAVSGVTAPVSRSSSEATMHSSRTSSANSLDSALAAATAEGPLQPLSALPTELRPLQPSNSAAGAGLRPHPNSSSPAAAAAAADTAAAVAASDSVSSEDTPSFLAAAAAGSSSSSGLTPAVGQLSATKRPDDHLLGYHHVKQWDMLWTKSVYAIRAARQLQQGQIVSAIAGLNCLSMKKRMVQTLRMVSEQDICRSCGLILPLLP